MTNVCKLLFYCFVILMHEDEKEANAATTSTSLTLGNITNDTNASFATTLSMTEISIKSPLSLITTQIMSDTLSVFLSSSTTTESTSESTNALHSKSRVTTLKSETDVFSFNESFTPISMMFKNSTISLSASRTITSLTADTSDITSSVSVTARSNSEATSVYPSMQFLETSLASETANVYSSISITTKLGKTTISPPASISRTASTSETLPISPSVSILETYQTYDTNTVSFSELFTTVYESTVLIPSETKTTKATSTSRAISPSSASTTASSSPTGTISHFTSVTATLLWSETIALSPSFTATLYASNFQPTTSLAASITASSTHAHTATYSSASFIATPSKTESTAMSSSTFHTTTATSEQTITSKKLFTVDLGDINLDLRFSIKVNKTFIEAYNIKGSSEFKELAKLFAGKLTQIYNNTVGFKYIDVREFRNGSVEAVYSVIISALVNLTEVKVYITGTVFNQLRALKINDSQVDETFLNETLSHFSASSRSKCDLADQKLCPFGHICEDLTQSSVLCSDKCNNQKCEYGSCYIDHQDESLLKCRCPIDDDGYVYTGDRCEHKSLSTLIIITSGVGGGVLLAAVFIICVICIKKRRKQDESDDHPVDSIPDYSKYFSRASIYQPMYGYDHDFGRGTRNGSVNLGGKSGYFLSNGNFHENMNYKNDDLDRHFGDNTSQLNRDESFGFIEMYTKFEIRRPHFR